MANAKRCDRCKNFYDEKEEILGVKNEKGIKRGWYKGNFIYSINIQDYMGRNLNSNSLDLCPTCSAGFANFMKFEPRKGEEIC